MESCVEYTSNKTVNPIRGESFVFIPKMTSCPWEGSKSCARSFPIRKLP